MQNENLRHSKLWGKFGFCTYVYTLVYLVNFGKVLIRHFLILCAEAE